MFSGAVATDCIFIQPEESLIFIKGVAKLQVVAATVNQILQPILHICIFKTIQNSTIPLLLIS